MSIIHLEMLRKALDKSNWTIRAELPGDEYKISGYWKVARPNGDDEFSIAFEGQDDLEVLPMDKAYACHVVSKEFLSLYFGKITGSFGQELNDFISQLS